MPITTKPDVVNVKKFLLASSPKL